MHAHMIIANSLQDVPMSLSRLRIATIITHVPTITAILVSDAIIHLSGADAMIQMPARTTVVIPYLVA